MPRSTLAREILPDLNSFCQVMAFLLLFGKQFMVLQMLLHALSSKDHFTKIRMSINIWTPNIKSLTFTITLAFVCCWVFLIVLSLDEQQILQCDPITPESVQLQIPGSQLPSPSRFLLSKFLLVFSQKLKSFTPNLRNIVSLWSIKILSRGREALQKW